MASWESVRNAVITVRGDDETRTVTATDEEGTVLWTRPYDELENDQADVRVASESMLTDLMARVARIEAHLWPGDDDPVDESEPIPDFQDYAGVWPHDTLLRESDGSIWRNVSGVPLTSSPLTFPGMPNTEDQWGHLFVRVVIDEGEPPVEEPPVEEPTRPEGYVGPWSADTNYLSGDVCDRDGHYYRCKVAHGAEYGGTWGPPQVGVWDEIGLVSDG